MKIETRVTIDGRTEAFVSSPKTLRANVLVTLTLARTGSDIRTRMDEALRAYVPAAGAFRLEVDGVSVEADPEPSRIQASISGDESPHIQLTGEDLSRPYRCAMACGRRLSRSSGSRASVRGTTAAEPTAPPSPWA
jgi:hypothetical protein